MSGRPVAGGRGRSERGFTLFELLIALTITVIGLAGLLSLHVSTVRGTASAGYSGDAVALAQDSLEDLRSKTVAEIQTDYFDNTTIPTTPTAPICSDTSGACNGASPGTLIGDTTGRAGTQFRQRFQAQRINGDLVWFRVEAYWSDDGADAPNPSTWANPRDGHRIAVEVVRSSRDQL